MFCLPPGNSVYFPSFSLSPYCAESFVMSRWFSHLTKCVCLFLSVQLCRNDCVSLYVPLKLQFALCLCLVCLNLPFLSSFPLHCASMYAIHLIFSACFISLCSFYFASVLCLCSSIVLHPASFSCVYLSLSLCLLSVFVLASVCVFSPVGCCYICRSQIFSFCHSKF